MNKYLFLAITFMVTAQKSFCITDVLSSELEQSLKAPAHEPGILSILVALFFVICLIYVTGLIYSKLNIIGAKTVKKQLKNLDLHKAVIVSTTQLGQNKNLIIVEVNNQRFLLGATPNSINLIKEFDVVKEESELILAKENEKEVAEEFDLHKKYL